MVLPDLGFEGRAELRLSARTPQKYNHHLCNSKSQRSAKILFHQREAKIDTGRNSRGRIATAISNINRVGIDNHLWVIPGELGRPTPMRRRSPSGEKTGLCQDKCAGTD